LICSFKIFSTFLLRAIILFLVLYIWFLWFKN